MALARSRRTVGLAAGLVLLGCALFAISVFLPAMRWDANHAHSTAGSARVFGGTSFTLTDGGFSGTALLPVAVFAVGVLAIVTAARMLGATAAWLRWVQLGAAVVALYYPLWVLHVFVKKTEDDVDPAVGVLVLVLAFGCIATGLLVGSRSTRVRASG